MATLLAQGEERGEREREREREGAHSAGLLCCD